MDRPGAKEDVTAWARAEEEQERLLEALKKEVKVDAKDIGTLRKELAITVPAQVIADHMEKNYSDLMEDAFVPGFRKGRAPRRLIEKRYGAEVRESLATSIVGQSFFAATENAELDVLGDPRFRIETDAGVKLVDIDEALQHLKLPETGDFTYICEVELKPEFELPELEGIEIRSPAVTITDEMVEAELMRLRKNRGRYELVEGGAEADDQVIVDVVLTVGGEMVKHDENLSLGVRPTQIEGIPVIDLGEKLVDAKAGDEVRAKVTIPPDFERVDLRGQKGEFTFKLHEIKRLTPQPLEDFLGDFGYESEEEARLQLREALEEERDRLVTQAKQLQVEEYLLAHTQLELPEEFSARQTARAVARRVIDLQQQGVPEDEIQARIDALRTSAHEQVARDLRLDFILDKVAEKLDVAITDEQVNTAIAQIARRYNRRFDRVRDDLRNRGLLGQFVQQIRQGACIQRLLESAKIVAAEAAAAPPKAGGRSKRTKKTTEESENA